MPTTYYEKSKRVYEPLRAWADRYCSENPDQEARDLFKATLAEINAAIVGWIRLNHQSQGGIYNIHTVLHSRAINAVWRMFQDRGLGEGAIVSYLTELWQYACFQESGEQTYEVAPGLAEHLFATEVRNVMCEYLRLPFKSIYIVVPKAAKLVIPYSVSAAIRADLPLQLRNQFREETGSHRQDDFVADVEGIWITEVPETRTNINGGRGWVFCIIGAGEYASEYPNGLGSVRKRTASTLPDNVIYTFEVPLPDGKTVQEAFDIRNDVIKKSILIGHKNPADVKWEAYFTWVMNFVLYLTYEPGKEVEEYWSNKPARQLRDRIEVAKTQGKKDKAQRLRAELKQLDPERRLYVGRHHPRLEEAETKPQGESQRHLNVRVLVSGHWRWQAHGTAWQDHKLIWIKPFWRGPPGAPISLPHRRIAT